MRLPKTVWRVWDYGRQVLRCERPPNYDYYVGANGRACSFVSGVENLWRKPLDISGRKRYFCAKKEQAIAAAQLVLAEYIRGLREDLARSENILQSLKDGTAGEDIIITKRKKRT